MEDGWTKIACWVMEDMTGGDAVLAATMVSVFVAPAFTNNCPDPLIR
jgi:hypothetical protein